MGSLLESLKHYFESTPKDILDQDWKSVEHLNDIGPDVLEYADILRKSMDIDIPYSYLEQQLSEHKYDVYVPASNSNISVDALYCLAA
ncbi:MAG: recombinase [Bacteroidia bacterium]|nr:recombinase [Bacteroidia bacterium]